MSLPEFEAWIRPLLHHTDYSDYWYWNKYHAEFDDWPTQEMKARGIEMRAEYAKGGNHGR